MATPNILLLIWDACRLEAARTHAPTLQSLAEQNLAFSNAITPAGYSLPSHVSLVTGEYPSEHRTYNQGQNINQMPLLDELGEAGYTRYGISANGFASPMYRFDSKFDHFYNTQGQMVYPDGLDVHRFGREIREQSDDKNGILNFSTVKQVCKRVLTHQRPLKSSINVGAAALMELTRHSQLLQQIPHPRFDPYSEFNYSPTKNTKLIQSILRKEATSEGPFFLFANYMDTHRPYAPPDEYQKHHCGRTFSYKELSHLNQIARPWQFIEQVEKGNPPDEDTLDTLRDLYAGEVNVVDDHLGRILATLEQNGLQEETVIIITADHGENLGEVDRLGEQRIGHVASASDHLLRVPLVVAHPSFETREVTEYVSIKDLRYLLTEGRPKLMESRGSDLSTMLPEAGVVSSQVPASGNESLNTRHPEVEEYLNRHISVAYTEGWKVCAMSTGPEYAWNPAGTEVTMDEAPDAAVEAARTNLEKLTATTGDNELSQTDIDHLEALGYLS